MRCDSEATLHFVVALHSKSSSRAFRCNYATFTQSQSLSRRQTVRLFTFGFLPLEHKVPKTSFAAYMLSIEQQDAGTFLPNREHAGHSFIARRLPLSLPGCIALDLAAFMPPLQNDVNVGDCGQS